MSKNEKTATYISRITALSIGLKSAYRKEVNGVHELVPGIRAQFEDGLYKTDDPEIIKLMDANKHNQANGGQYFKQIDAVKMDRVSAAAQAAMQEDVEEETKVPRKTVSKGKGKTTEDKQFD